MDHTKRNIILYTIGAVVLFFVFNIASYATYDALRSGSNLFSGSDSDSDFSSDDEGYDGSCNVRGLAIHGDMYTYIPQTALDDPMYAAEYGYADAVSSEYIVDEIYSAESDPDIKAIMLDVDSYGGSPVAGEEIATAIRTATKPVIAFIRGAGVSSGYWAVTTADRIFASKNSDVGSIGVTMSYVENVDQNEFDGLNYVQLISGKYKDAGSPDRKLTEEEKSIFQRDLKIMHENFIQEVATNRNIPVEKVRAIADGSSMLGERAKELGLIDAIGGYNEAKRYAEEKIGEKVIACW